MADILGAAVTEEGVGSNRKSRNEKINVRHTRLDTGGSPNSVANVGVVDPRTVGAIQAPGITARFSTSAKTLTTPKDQGPLVDEKVVAVGMSTLARSAVSYANKSLELKAREAVLKYRDTMFQSFHDEEKGFRFTKGFEATDGFANYEAATSNSMLKAVEGLDPAAKQMAMMSLYSIREDYLGKATTHVVNERKQLEDDIRTSEIKSLAKIMVATPQDIMPLPDGTPSRLKEEFFSKFDSRKQAEAAWQGAIIQAGERIYLDGAQDIQGNGFSKGLVQIKQYRDSIGKGELKMDALNNLDSYIMGRENAEVIAFNRKETAAQIESDKYQKEKSIANMAKILRDVGTEAQVSTNSVYDMAATGAVTLPFAEAYEKRIAGELGSGGEAELDRQLYARLHKAIRVNGTHLSDGTSLVEMAAKSSGIPNTEFKSLVTLAYNIKDEKLRSDLNRGETRIKAFVSEIKDPFYFGSVTEDEQYLESAAITELEERLSGGEDYDSAILAVEKNWSNIKLNPDKLAPFWDGSRPTQPQDLSVILDDLEAAVKSGKMDQAEVNAQKNLWYKWRDALSKQPKRN